MVYDPIRDCEFPSPAVAAPGAASAPWAGTTTTSATATTASATATTATATTATSAARNGRQQQSGRSASTSSAAMSPDGSSSSTATAATSSAMARAQADALAHAMRRTPSASSSTMEDELRHRHHLQQQHQQQHQQQQQQHNPHPLYHQHPNQPPYPYHEGYPPAHPYQQAPSPHAHYAHPHPGAYDQHAHPHPDMHYPVASPGAEYMDGRRVVSEERERERDAPGHLYSHMPPQFQQHPGHPGHPHPHHPLYSHPQQPVHPADMSSSPIVGHASQHAPTPTPTPGSAAGSGGALRGLLNNETNDGPSRRRSSDRARSISSSIAGEDDSLGGSAPPPRASLSKLLNDSGPPSHHSHAYASIPLTKSSSTSSLAAPGSSPSNPSPGLRAQHLDPNGFLTPGTPASALGPAHGAPPPQPQRISTSRSPHAPLSTLSPASAGAHSALPPEHYHRSLTPAEAAAFGVTPTGLPSHAQPGQPVPPHTPSGPVVPGPSRRRSSVDPGARPAMLPPSATSAYPPGDPRLPPHDGAYDYRGTPGGSHLSGLPTVFSRSPSVSVSPRSVHQSLPSTTGPSHPPSSLSRPGSSSSRSASFSQHLPHSHTFSFQPPSVSSQSPSTPARRLSEDPQGPRPLSDPRRPLSGVANGRRETMPVLLPGNRTGSGSSLESTPISFRPDNASFRSPSPISAPPPHVSRTPYDPTRISSPHKILFPILPDELERIRDQISASDGMLRKKKAARPLPSWSTPTPRHTIPSESDGSYFPPVPAQGSSGGAGPARSQTYGGHEALMTPGGSGMRAGMDDFPSTPGIATPSVPARGRPPKHRPLDEGGNHLKRVSSDHEGDDHDSTRRKVSQVHYVGNAGAVANFYNSRPEVGVEGREFSPIIGLKKFNNWIKSVLIGKFSYRDPGKPGARVLDIGCGKGGDLNKWKQARIRLYVGVDIAETSIEQAQARYRTMNRPGFDGRFFAYDCFAKSINDILPEDLREQYDTVSLQFCMHYAFETASKARMMIENVSRNLRKGGQFIGTIPNASLLLERLDAIPEGDELRFGNDCYAIEFSERRHKGLYGHQYNFFLADAVDAPEYVVQWDNFVSLALEYGLKLVYKKTFNEVLQEEQSSRDFGPLLGKMGVLDAHGASAMDTNQWEAANLYMAFAFEKVR